MKQQTLSTLTRMIFLVMLTSSISMAQTVRLGIVADFPENERADVFIQQFKEEIGKTIGSRKTLQLKDSDVLTMDWDYSKATGYYNALVKRCDLVLLLGSGSIHSVLEQGDFPKPTIGLGVFDPEMQNVPLTENGTSGVKNFSYILSSQDIERELARFQQIVPYKNVTLVLDRRFAPLFNDNIALQRMQSLGKQLGTNIERITLDDDIVGSMSKLSESTDAVYLVIPYGRTPEEIQQVADYLNAKKIPSFTMNRRDVDSGIMGCMSTDNDLNQILRKAAIMSDEAISGVALADMPVSLNFREELHLNRMVMDKIGVDPTFETLFTAKFIGDDPIVKGERHNLEDIIGWALEENLDIKISDLDVELAQQDLRTAKSQFLPTIDASGSMSLVNEEQTSPLTGQAERSITGVLSLQQLLFSEEALAGSRIQAYLKKADEAAAKQTALDIILDTFTGYFNLLQAKTNLRIQSENLDVSKTNLELARLSVSLGASNRADIYRWESEVATAQQSVVEAYGLVAFSQTQLNSYLNGKLGTEFDVEEVGIDAQVYQTLSSSFIDSHINSPDRFNKLINFFVVEAQQHSFSKKQLHANLQATKRQISSNKRRFFLPTLSLSGSGNNNFWRAGNGSVPATGVEFQDLNWSVGVNLSIPLFEGNRRRIDVQKSTLQKRQLEYQLGSLDQNLQLLVTSSAIDLLTAKTNIRFSKIAEENSQKNFELVQDYYRNGTVSVIQLIDAQEAALQAKQGYANSVYQYLTAFIGLENSLGRYGLLATQEENAAFNTRFESFIKNEEGQQ
ncbi:MAG: TolC family protein [Calditrichia bacterium]